jgi:hypothetical protein
MVNPVQPRTYADESNSGLSAGKPLLVLATLRAFGRRLLWAVQGSRRRRGAIVVRQYTHLFPRRSGGDHDSYRRPTLAQPPCDEELMGQV